MAKSDRTPQHYQIDLNDSVRVDEALTTASGIGIEPYHRQPNTALYNIQLYKQKIPDRVEYSAENIIKSITNEFDRVVERSLNLLWQRKPKNSDGFVECSFADVGEYIYGRRRLSTEETQTIKNGLLRLGGNVFYFWERTNQRNHRGKMVLVNELLFKIRFATNLTEEELLATPEENLLGTKQLFILKEGLGQRITGFSFKPCDVFINEIEKGEGLGYTTIKDSEIRALRLQNTIQNNWFDYIARLKKKKGKLKLDTAIRIFGLTERLNKRGKPGCLKVIKEGFENQIKRGNIRGKYDKTKEMFFWTRTDKAIIKEVKQPEAKSESYYIKKPENARLRAMVSLLALQGLRQIELVRLNVSDLDLKNKVAFIQGKGRDDKEPVDLHPETVEALKSYLSISKKKSGTLFTSASNRITGDRRITTRSIRRIIKSELGKVKIDKTTHGFRHYFTTTLIKAYKGDLLEVAQYTRHRGLEMLQVYNDSIKKKEDLPRYYNAFSGVKF